MDDETGRHRPEQARDGSRPDDHDHVAAVLRRAAGEAETRRANLRWWDAEAVPYYTEHGSFLGDAEFCRQAARTTGLSEEALASSVVADPFTTVRQDVDRLLVAPEVSTRVGVSGHVYDLDTGRVTTVVDTRFPAAGGRHAGAVVPRVEGPGPGKSDGGGGGI